MAASIRAFTLVFDGLWRGHDGVNQIGNVLGMGLDRGTLAAWMTLQRFRNDAIGMSAAGYLPLAIDFATSCAHSMKRSTTGLNVRFFNVTIATGHGRAGRSTGNTFNAL